MTPRRIETKTLDQERAAHAWDCIQDVLKLKPEEQRQFMREHPRMFEPSSGAWGRQGCTDVKLAAADRATIRGAMVLAWEAVVAKPAARRKPAARKNRKRNV